MGVPRPLTANGKKSHWNRSSRPSPSQMQGGFGSRPAVARVVSLTGASSRGAARGALGGLAPGIEDDGGRGAGWLRTSPRRRRASEHHVQMGACIGCSCTRCTPPSADYSPIAPAQARRRATKTFPEVQAPQGVNRLHCAERAHRARLGFDPPAGRLAKRPTSSREAHPQLNKAFLQVSAGAASARAALAVEAGMCRRRLTHALRLC